MATAADEFDTYEATGEAPAPPAPGDGGGVRGARPVLHFPDLAPPAETVDVRGRLYELTLLSHLPLGIQTGLTVAYNATIRFSQREADAFLAGLPGGEAGAGEDARPLDEQEERQRRFLLEKIVAHALPGLPAEARAALAVPELEAITRRFFIFNREIRDAAERRSAPSTSGGSSPGSSASTGATSTAGSPATTRASSRRPRTSTAG